MQKVRKILQVAPIVIGGLLITYILLIFVDVRRMQAVELANKTFQDLDQQLKKAQERDAQEQVKQARRALDEDFDPLASLRVAIDAWDRAPTNQDLGPIERRSLQHDIWSVLADAWQQNVQIDSECLVIGCPANTLSSAYLHWPESTPPTAYSAGRLYRFKPTQSAESLSEDFRFDVQGIEVNAGTKYVGYAAYQESKLLLFAESGAENGWKTDLLDLNPSAAKLVERLPWNLPSESALVGFSERLIVFAEPAGDSVRVVTRKVNSAQEPEFVLDVASGTKFGFAALIASDRLVIATYRALDETFEYTLTPYDWNASGWRQGVGSLVFQSGSTFSPQVQYQDRASFGANAQFGFASEIIDPESGMMVISRSTLGRETNAAAIAPSIIDLKSMSSRADCKGFDDSGQDNSISGPQRDMRLIGGGALLGVIDRGSGDLLVFDIRPQGDCRLVERISVEGDPIVSLIETGSSAQVSKVSFLVGGRSGAIYRAESIDLSEHADKSSSENKMRTRFQTMRRRDVAFGGHESKVIGFSANIDNGAGDRFGEPSKVFMSISEDSQASIWRGEQRRRTGENLISPRRIQTPAEIGRPSYAKILRGNVAAVVGDQGAALVNIRDESARAIVQHTSGQWKADPQTANFSQRAGYFYAIGQTPGAVNVWAVSRSGATVAGPYQFVLEELGSQTDEILSVEVSEQERFLLIRTRDGTVAYGDLREFNTTRQSQQPEIYKFKRLLTIPSDAEFVNLRIVDRSEVFSFSALNSDEVVVAVIIDGEFRAFDLLGDGKELLPSALDREAFLQIFVDTSAYGSASSEPDMNLLDVGYHSDFGLVALAQVDDGVRAVQIYGIGQSSLTGLLNAIVQSGSGVVIAGEPSAEGGQSSDNNSGYDQDTPSRRVTKQPFEAKVFELHSAFPLRRARPSIQFFTDTVILSDGTRGAVLVRDGGSENRLPFLVTPLVLIDQSLRIPPEGSLLLDEAGLSLELPGPIIAIRNLDFSTWLYLANVQPTRNQYRAGFAGSYPTGDDVVFVAHSANSASSAGFFLGDRGGDRIADAALFALPVGQLKTARFVEVVRKALGGGSTLTPQKKLRYGVGEPFDRGLIKRSQASREDLADPGFFTGTFIMACEGVSGVLGFWLVEDECLAPFAWAAKWRRVEMDLKETNGSDPE